MFENMFVTYCCRRHSRQGQPEFILEIVSPKGLQGYMARLQPVYLSTGSQIFNVIILI